jgi:hypothetical protein
VAKGESVRIIYHGAHGGHGEKITIIYHAGDAGTQKKKKRRCPA